MKHYRLNTVERTLAADRRAQQAGHHAFIDGRRFKVKSTSEPGIWRHVRILAVAGTLLYVCDCPAGQNRPSYVPCVHAARCCRRLRREGLARWDGTAWRTTPKADRLAPQADDDPFAGLPS